MKIVGILLWVSGAIALGVSSLMPTSVPNTDSSSILPDQIVNIGLQQQQLIVVLIGLASFVAGSLIHAIGAALDRLAPQPAGTAAEPSLPSKTTTELSFPVTAPTRKRRLSWI